jgi:hypothetical protein
MRWTVGSSEGSGRTAPSGGGTQLGRNSLLLLTPHTEGDGSARHYNSQQHPILDIDAKDVDPLDKHVQSRSFAPAGIYCITPLSNESAVTSPVEYIGWRGQRSSSLPSHTRLHEQ